MIFKKSHSILLSFMFVAGLLSACQTTGSSSSSASKHSPEYIASSITNDSFVQSMVLAAYEAEQKSLLQEAAIFMAKAYDKQPDNEEIAWRYARLLRLNNRTEQAVTLLTPYSVREAVPTPIIREYVAAQLANGELEQAYIEAQKLDAKSDKNARAYNVLGVVADANGFHDEAISYFVRGLDMVNEGDKYHAILMNNKALAELQKGAGAEAMTSIKSALSGSQDFPQIKDNFDALKGLSGNMKLSETIESKAQISQPIVEDIDQSVPANETETVVETNIENVDIDASFTKMQPIIE